MDLSEKGDPNKALFLSVSAGSDPPKSVSPPEKISSGICGTHYPLSIAFIVVNEFCERFSYYGMKAVLTLYFLYFLHWDETTSTSVYHAFSSLCYFTPVIGAFIADSWLGKYKTIIYLSIVYVIGHVIKSVGAMPNVGNQIAHVILSMTGLSLIALGTGGIKPCVAAFGGDQFEDKHVQERNKFFSVFYLAINAGSLISTFLTPVLRGSVQCFGGDCYALAFGVPAALMIVALVVFITGNRLYKKTPPQGNILLKVCKCIVFALRNRIRNRSPEIPKRQHWLDWASEKYSNQLITEVKMVTRVLFLFVPLPMFWALFDQQGSRWTLQATKMNADFEGFVLQPDQMQFLNPLLILVFIPVFDFGLYPLVNLCRLNFTPIKKMATGMILASLAFAAAAIVELKIEENTMPTPVPKESYIQVLNLADSDVEVTIEGYDLFRQPIKTFQDPAEYSRLILNSDQQLLHFKIQHQGLSSTFSHLIHEKSLNSLIIYKRGGNLTTNIIEDMQKKPSEGMAAVRFINTLEWDVNVTLGDEEFTTVNKSYGVSEYRILPRGRYNNAKFQMRAEVSALKLGLLDFGASYTVVLTQISTETLQAWKIEDIPANNVHISWQMPQYLLISAGEVMFSITGLAFSYSQAPVSMKSVLQAGWLLTVAFGNVIVLIVAQSAPLVQWAEFILFAMLLFIVFVIFSIMGYFYISTDPEELADKGNEHETSSNKNMIGLVTRKTEL
ncbi:solute carrier family 15 member 2 isoform X1 [Crotalus tigris]|uniref:solute carrier family 15 member 2 isoform X1 n=2 Tax=Crotalus tigris TaxID=88082 RepID=UPI00192F813A|nr:solute carrier family 15 member 2 isoform X1 [Crotalus tigris]